MVQAVERPEIKRHQSGASPPPFFIWLRHRTKYTYDPQFGEIESITRQYHDVFGVLFEATWQWDYEYDPASGLLLSTTETDPSDVVTRFEYDALGNVMRHTVAPGTADETVTTFTYDSLSRLETRQDGMQRVTRYGYNGWDEVTSVSLEGPPVPPPTPLTSPTTYDTATGRRETDFDFKLNPDVVRLPFGHGRSDSHRRGWIDYKCRLRPLWQPPTDNRPGRQRHGISI